MPAPAGLKGPAVFVWTSSRRRTTTNNLEPRLTPLRRRLERPPVETNSPLQSEDGADTKTKRKLSLFDLPQELYDIIIDLANVRYHAESDVSFKFTPGEILDGCEEADRWLYGVRSYMRVFKSLTIRCDGRFVITLRQKPETEGPMGLALDTGFLATKLLTCAASNDWQQIFRKGLSEATDRMFFNANYDLLPYFGHGLIKGLAQHALYIAGTPTEDIARPQEPMDFISGIAVLDRYPWDGVSAVPTVSVPRGLDAAFTHFPHKALLELM